VLGICLGAQLMARKGHEFGEHEGLGWIDAEVAPLAPGDPVLRLPHVGWNGIRPLRDDRLLEGIPPDALFYFVHSFYIRCSSPDAVVAECEYGQPFAAVIHRGNICGTQFHPEKSQRHGLTLLQNFLALPGRADLQVCRDPTCRSDREASPDPDLHVRRAGQALRTAANGTC
jgi:glutamine amidotransferase